MKDIVFELGGVLFARDKSKCTQDFIDFFSFIRTDPMPEFWVEYDRGTRTAEEVIGDLCRVSGRSRAICEAYFREAIDRQEPIVPTEGLVRDLKAAGYRLFVLSNMSPEFIEFLRRVPVYALFEGEVVSCEERTVKPERRIYEILLDRYRLDPAETLFIDDRAANIAMARELGINGFRFDSHDAAASCEALRRLLL